MIVRWILATLHLIALGIGLGAIFARGYVLRRMTEARALRTVFLADSFWALAGVLWLTTGLLRAFGGFEKGSDYYVHSSSFWIKMALFVTVVALEIWPVMTLFQWRLQGLDFMPKLSAVRGMAWISYIQALLVVLIVLAATAMARGLNP
ncbi:MAG TPA: DUF2214 family protein [Gammaproteobacteria bacterium]|nr:DUF2214 family protein [Gammaproteobacteria bacterium]